jgi:hypothetical protein
MSRDLGNARKKKNDEFYTVYEYIQKEVNAYLDYNPDVFRGKTVLMPCDDPEWSNFTKFFAQNFETLELKKLISTSYAADSKADKGYQFTIEDYLTDYEKNSAQYDASKTSSKGKIFTLTRDINYSGKIDIDDLEWSYLEGDGDFRSDEVRALRDKADIIITNPPFSQFREFVSWIIEANKECLIIGSQNAITYKEIFPLIKENKLWLGVTCNSEDMVFRVPEGTEINPKDREKAAKLGYVGSYTRLGNANWFTNIEHGRRHVPISLMSQSDNLKFSKHRDFLSTGYQDYYNFDAIEIPYLDAIPSDYNGVMGVPITFLSKYCPEQFEILGFGAGELGVQAGVRPYDRSLKPLSSALRDGIPYIYDKDSNTVKVPYARIFIRKRTQK